MIGQQLIPNDSALTRLTWIAIEGIIAALTYGAIESPIRFQTFLIVHSRLTIWLGVLAAIWCVGAIGTWLAILFHSEQSTSILSGMLSARTGSVRFRPRWTLHASSKAF